MSELTQEQIDLFQVPPQHAHLLMVKGVFTFADEVSQIVLVSPKADYRDQLLVEAVKNDESLKTDIVAQEEAMMEPRAIDAWDSGIQYLVTEVEGKKRAHIVARIDSYTHTIAVQDSLIEAKLDAELQLDANTRFRAWEEGTIITVKTVVVNGERKAFYSTRKKIDARASKWSKPGSPTILAEFFTACNKQDISISSIEREGMCFAFILKSEWNATKQKITEPVVILFRAYSFADGEYREVDESVAGAAPVRTFNLAEAVQHISDGGVVMTMFSFNNKKFMNTDTKMVYSWFENSQTSSPDEQYFKLLAQNQNYAKRYRSLLGGHAKESLEKSLENLEPNITATAEYLKYCVEMAVKQRRLEPKMTNPKDRKPVHENGVIAYIVRQAMKHHRESQEERKAASTAKPGRGKNVRGKKAPVRRSKDVEDLEQVEFIKSILVGFQKEDTVKLVKLIRICARYKRTDIARLKAQEARMNEIERPVTPTFGTKAKSELKGAIKTLEQIFIFDETEYFIPGQVDDDEASVPKGKWVKEVKHFMPGQVDDDEAPIPEGNWVKEDEELKGLSTFSDDE